jgi:putative phosphoribosyl transferase
MASTPRYRDRHDAGEAVARALSAYAGRDDLVVLALPRGGVPVAYPVARSLGAPLDVFIVRKLGYPGEEELAMGAIASGDVVVLDEELARTVPGDALDAILAREREELGRREREYRDGRARPAVEGKTAILVDDGLATGSTMRAAVAALRKERPARIVVAVPIAAPETCAAFEREVDDIICAATPEPFYAVGLWYADFSQTTDVEVRDLLARAAREGSSAAARRELPVVIVAGDVEMEGDLTVPAGAVGLVLFAHGSGSSRKSSRNRFVAGQLNGAGIATLLFDLLTPAEEERERWTAHLRFDIALLAVRLLGATAWVRRHPYLSALRVGYFGASTGAAAALIAAARGGGVAAVVSRGGRPDLAGEALPSVSAPTLLVVGGDDHPVVELNEEAFAMLTCGKRLEIVPGATHLFEEPGALERVAVLARDWFREHLTERAPDRGVLPSDGQRPAPR